MTENSLTDNTSPGGHSEVHWALLWGVRRSIRYHRRREQWLDGVHNFSALATATAGSATVATLLAGIAPWLVTTVAAVTAFFGACEIVFGPAKKARLHSELARDFIGLEQALVRAGEDLPEAQMREFEAQRLDIESREPPVLRVLDAMCHDELVRALGIDESERSEPEWYQRWFAHVFDVGAHRLRRQSAGERGAA